MSFDGLTRWAVTRHIQEIELIRSKVYSLENQHNQMKAKYATPMPSPSQPQHQPQHQPQRESRPLTVAQV